MNLKHASAGLALLLLVPMAAHAASGKTLYQRLMGQVEREQGEGTADDDVATFIHLILKDTWDDLTQDDVKTVMKGDGLKVCGDKPEDSQLKIDAECDEMIRSVQRIAADQQKVRQLGRNLESIATSYELPLSDLPDRALRLSADLQGILSIWSAGTGSIKSENNAPVVRTVTIPDDDEAPVNQDDVEDIVKDLARELNELTEEQRIAAVWFYREGVRLVRDERSPRFPTPYVGTGSDVGTERQYLFKRWNDATDDSCDQPDVICVEKYLQDLLSAAGDIPVNPPLTSSETAYVLFPDNMLDGVMPDNVIIWIRLDGDTENNQPFGDAGLQWSIPLEPVLPSLFYEEDDEKFPIKGGAYPPQPVRLDEDGNITGPLDGMMLCTNTVSLRGYLCRELEEAAAESRCPTAPEPNEEIQLVACTKTIDGYDDTWCCDPGSRQCSAVKSANVCTQRGGKPSASAAGCAVNGCAVPSTNPVFCCLPSAQNNRCVQMVNASSCTSQGGKTSDDASGCVTNGCSMPAADAARYTAASSDVCREIDWKLSEPFDPNTQCKLVFRCSQNCAPGMNASAITSLKQPDGTISICMNNQTEFANTYLLYHELIHAYDLCDMPPGYDVFRDKTQEEKNEVCCLREGEAYRTQCDIMERDGVFSNPDGSPVVINGITFNATTCAEAWTNFACGSQQGYNGCFTTHEYSQAFLTEMVTVGKRNPKNVPASCSDAIDLSKMDPRVSALKELVEARDDVCTPQTVTDYKNRIGNNLCFIGQCVEQSTELHRLTGGRSPMTTGDGIAPWQEPSTGTPLGNILTNPSVATYRFPAYRPQLLARTLDQVLCQSVGFPPLMPPSLCAIEASRQLELSRAIGSETAIGLVNQALEQREHLEDLTDLSRGIGIRAGTELYANYLLESNRSFADIIRMANTLLNDLKGISFPTEMCPVGPGLPAPLSSSASSQ